MVRCDRRKAPAADTSDAAPLGLHAAPSLAVVGRLDETGLTRPDLERERALTGFGQQLSRIEPVPDLVREPQPVEPACGEDDGVEAALPAFAKPRIDVSSQRLDRESRLDRE